MNKYATNKRGKTSEGYDLLSSVGEKKRDKKHKT